LTPRAKYPSKKVVMPVMLIATAVVMGLGNSSVSAEQATNNSYIQNNAGTFTSQPNSPDNASNYFVLKSQQDLFNAVKTGQAEEIFAKIEQKLQVK
jgi:hypothetical protein